MRAWSAYHFRKSHGVWPERAAIMVSVVVMVKDIAVSFLLIISEF
jgi:hypothetical protein